jgi:hypothetical protein
MKTWLVVFAVLAASAIHASAPDSGDSPPSHGESTHARLAACFKGPGGSQGYDMVSNMHSKSDCYNACDNFIPNKSCQGGPAGDCYERCDANDENDGWF